MTYNKQWYKDYTKKNRLKLNEKQRKWSKDNKDKRNKYTTNWKKAHPKIVKEMKHKSYVKNREKAIATVKKYYEKNKEKIKLRIKTERDKNKKIITQEEKEIILEKRKERRKFTLKEYRKKHREHLNSCINIKRKEYLLNIDYRINCNIGSEIWHAIKQQKAGKKWQVLVGYSLKELKNHLEKQFDKKMSWKNYGSYWHVDHIKPKSLFKFYSHEDEEFKKCWSLSNLQPLEKIANLKKGNKYEGV